MTPSEQKIAQYLHEARASELALIQTLQSQIAITPRGRLRQMLETHLRETRVHAERLQARLTELGMAGGGPGLIGAVEGLIGRTLAVAKTPLDLLRGSGGEEKLLKNAKDDCAAEALEIATYTAIEQLAEALGDAPTAELAAAIRDEEEAMLQRLLHEIPRLSKAVVSAEVNGRPVYDLAETGAADAAREAGEAVEGAARRATAGARRGARKARRVPGVARAEGRAKGAVASADDLAIPGYDELTASEIADRLSGLSQIDLAKVDAYERRNESRTTILGRIASLSGDEPWPGYDDEPVSAIRERLGDADERLARDVRAYERTHKGRAGVLEATERTLAHS